MKSLIISFFLGFVMLGQLAAQSDYEAASDTISKNYCKCVEIYFGEEDAQEKLNECLKYAFIDAINRGLITNDDITDSSNYRYLRNLTENKIQIKCGRKLNAIKTGIIDAPEDMFIDSVFFAKYNLLRHKQGDEYKEWKNPEAENEDENPDYVVVFDVRKVFVDKQKAEAYYNSTIEKSKGYSRPCDEEIELEGVDKFTVFREKAKEGEELKKREHYFVFLIDNVFAKVLVATNDDIDTEDAVLFPEEAIKKINLVIKSVKMHEK